MKVNKCQGASFDNTGSVLACLYSRDERSKQVQQIHMFNTESYENAPFQVFNLEDVPPITQFKFSFNGKFILLCSN